MGYCLMCGQLAETHNGLCRQCQEDEDKRAPKQPETAEVTLESIEASARKCHTKISRAMIRAVAIAKAYGARWWAC